MIVYADSPAIAKQLEDVFGLNEDEIIQDVPSWPLLDDCVIGISSFSRPIFFHCIRVAIAHVDKGVRIAFVKREWNGEDEERLERAVRTEYNRLHRDNDNCIQSIQNLCDGKWKEERLQHLMTCKTLPMIEYSTFMLGHGLKDEIRCFFNERTTMKEESLTQVTAKPPNLHWTPVVLDGDIEVSFRFRFPQCLPSRKCLTVLAETASHHFSSVYEWSDGVLISCDPGRVHIQKTSNTQLEVAGRICYEELQDVSTACTILWPQLSFALNTIFSFLSQSPHLHYHLDLLLIGRPLFSPSIQSRVFDMTTFMNTAVKFRKVGFICQNELYSVQLDKLFPNGVPVGPCSFFEMGKSLRPVRVASPSSYSNTPSTLCLPHSRGRRVSFGAIRTIGGPETLDEYVDNILQQSIDHLVHS